jgi:hypothetical protein
MGQVCVCQRNGSSAAQKGCWMDGFFLDWGGGEGIKE